MSLHMDIESLPHNSLKHRRLYSKVSDPNPKTPKRHEKTLKSLSMYVKTSKQIKKVISSNRVFKLSPNSTLSFEIEEPGHFRFAYLRRFFKTYKKYIRGLNIRIAEDTFITDHNMKQFLRCFKQVFNLKHLDLEFSSFESAISDKGLGKVLHQLRVYPLLRTFNILCNGAYNCLKDDSMVNFARVIRRKKSIEKLGMNLRGADNIITDRGLDLFNKGIAAPITSLKSLRLDFRSFGINNNKLTDSGAYFLSLALLKLNSLEELFLDFSGGSNAVGDDGLVKLAESLKNLKKLKSFTLDCQMGGNEVSGRSVRALVANLEHIPTIKYLNFNFSNFPTMYGGDNCIGDSGLLSLFSLLYNKPDIQEFILKVVRNNISDYGVRELAKKTYASKSCSRLDCDFRENPNISKDGAELLKSSIMGFTSNCIIHA